MIFKGLNRNLSIFSIVILTFTYVNSQAQNHFIRYGDTSVVESKMLKFGEVGMWVENFKSGIQDGIWYICPPVKKSDTTTCKVKYMAKVTIKNGMKQGVLEYTHPYDYKTPQLHLNYINDTLHGYFFMTGFAGQKIEEGYYEKGKKNGLFIEYFEKKDNKESAKEIRLYRMDTLLYWQLYFHNELIRGHGNCISPYTKCECVFYDTLGVIFSKGFFNSLGELYKVQYFNESGLITKEFEGDFKNSDIYSFSSFSLHEIGLSKIELFHGTIRLFSNGSLVSQIIKEPD